MTDDDKLQPFEGKLVLNSAVEIPNAAGGLREPMQFEPRELHHDEEVYVVLRSKVRKVRFDPIKDTDALTRVAVLDVVEGMFVDADLVAKHLAEQRARLAEAREEREAKEKGLERLNFPSEEELRLAHTEGEHDATAVDGCPTCQQVVVEADAAPAAEQPNRARAAADKKAAAAKKAPAKRASRANKS